MPLRLQHQLILRHQLSAVRVARGLLKRWGVAIGADETASLAWLALCEAARLYHHRRGARFMTYCFYFIKGALAKEIQRRIGESAYVPIPREEKSDGMEAAEEIAASGPSPEERAWAGEIGRRFKRAAVSLPALQKDVVIRSFVLEEKMTAIARRHRLSRTYLFAVRAAAVRKLRTDLLSLAA